MKQCCKGLGSTSTWKKSTIQVKGATTLEKGTAIATFDSNGKYCGHAAIYVGQKADGLQVWDQWQTHPVSPRNIAFRGGKGSVVNDGDQYFVVD